MPDEVFDVACIGSRVLTPAQEEVCFNLGFWIAKNKGRVCSGNSSPPEKPFFGADAHFAMGANSVNPKLVYLYQPWIDFNYKQIVNGNHVTNPPYPQEMTDLVLKEYKGRISSKWVLALHTRNVPIVQHRKLCLAFPNNTPWGGGTGFGMQLARENFGVEVIDLRSYGRPELRDLCRRIEAMGEGESDA